MDDLFLILFVVWWITLIFVTAAVAKAKGIEPAPWVVLALLLGPIGFAGAWAMPIDQVALQRRRIVAGTRKVCPACAEAIRSPAEICPHCGTQQPQLPATDPA